MEHNKCEREIWMRWSEAFPEWRSVLCPVLWSDRWGLLVVMPRCDLAGPEVAEHMLRDDVFPHPAPPWEGKPADFGLLRARAVAFDYATSPDIFDRGRLADYARRRGVVLPD
jgi:hypothetical protein